MHTNLFFAPSSFEKANPNWLLIVISESLNCGHDFSFQLFFFFFQVIKSTSLGFEIQVFEVTAKLKLYTKSATVKTLRPSSSSMLHQITTVCGPNHTAVIDFNFPKHARFWAFSDFTLIIFRDIEHQRWHFSVWTPQWGRGGRWCIGWNRTTTKQKVQCTGHLFYVIGNKNG